MGTCVSRPENCVGAKFGVSKKKMNRKRKKALKRRVPAHFSDRSRSDSMERFPSLSFNDPTFHGSAEEAWFDSAAILESDWSDEDFQSFADDVISKSGSGGSSTAGKTSPSRNSSTCTSVSEASRSIVSPDTRPVFADEVSCSAGENPFGQSLLLDNSGSLPNNCLPCLVSPVPCAEKRRSISSSPPSTRKKAALKLSFTWKEGRPPASLFSSKVFLQRPRAGSQVPFSLPGKQVTDSWSDIEPGTFKIRSENYFRDRRKEFASNHAAYYPFGVDVFLSQRKIEHVARFVELPAANSSGDLPAILVVNVQIPLYPAALFNGETDGEGINFVLYFHLAESVPDGISNHFQENIRRLINDDAEKARAFPREPFRDRLKILGRVANVDDLPMSAAERALMHAYNEKPVLSRPQHEFFSGRDYFEIDLDMHRFSYISRKGFEAFLDRLKFCVLDFGLTIQGSRPEELPEEMLCCVRLNGIDYRGYQKLG